ncbi:MULTISPECIES: hypothetical protein [unclassified Akkermansia]|nr:MULTISPECIES: hypothetical protein [unclassified Akkermansia]
MAAYRNHAVSASLSMSHNTVSCPAEPATATLGLLGLGTLLLRCRR